MGFGFFTSDVREEAHDRFLTVLNPWTNNSSSVEPTVPGNNLQTSLANLKLEEASGKSHDVGEELLI